MTEQQKKTLGLAIASFVCGLLFLFPLLGFIFSVVAVVLGIVSLVKISNNKDEFKGSGLAIAGISLGALGILLVPIVALLAAIAIPNLLRARVNANDALAKSTLKTLAVASETFATANQGVYPMNIMDLTAANPPYIQNAYCGETISGFMFLCSFAEDGYIFKAAPVQIGTTGTTTYTITTGGVLTPKTLGPISP